MSTAGPAEPWVNPSLLAADFARLAESAARAGGADLWHVDVMDYHFVPNLTLGLPVVEALLEASDVPLDCHLMIEDPARWAPSYAEAGAASVTVHVEACGDDPRGVLRDLRAAGSRAGIAVKPGTDLGAVVDLLDDVDLLLLMTVEPGFGGQSFMSEVLPKVREARRLLDDRRIGRDDRGVVRLQVDGGVDEDTAVECARAGADTFVAGSAVYGADDPAEAVRRLREAVTDRWEP